MFEVLMDYLIMHPTLLTLLMVYSVGWKAFVLWRAAKRGHLIWYVVLLATNTLGILDALYWFWFSNRSLGKQTKKRA